MSSAAPHRSPVAVLEELLEGRGIVRKAAGGGLLTGLGARLTRASALPSRGGARESLPTGVDDLDRLLSGGLPRGGVVEIVARRSSGRFSLALSVLAAATSCGEAAALVDVGGHLDPQSAEEAGVDLERLLWVRPEKLKQAVAAAEMLLATGFALVVVDLGVPPVRGRFVPDAAWVRLERAARERGAALLLLSPYRVGATAEAVVALEAAHPIWRGERRAPPMLSGIGARMTLQKDASAKEGARGQLRLSADPMLDLSPPRPALLDSSRIPGPASSTGVGAGLVPAPLSRRSAPQDLVAPRDDSGEAPLTLPFLPDGSEADAPRNHSPQKSVLPNGDGTTPFTPPSPIPGEGGIFFRPPSPSASAPAQLSLLS